VVGCYPHGAIQPTRLIEPGFAADEAYRAVSRNHHRATPCVNCANHEWTKVRAGCGNSRMADNPAELRQRGNSEVEQSQPANSRGRRRWDLRDGLRRVAVEGAGCRGERATGRLGAEVEQPGPDFALRARGSAASAAEQAQTAHDPNSPDSDQQRG
jgi:hypothetical protein